VLEGKAAIPPEQAAQPGGRQPRPQPPMNPRG